MKTRKIKQLEAKIKSLEAQKAKEDREKDLLCEIGTVLSYLDKKLDRIEEKVGKVLSKYEAQGSKGETEKASPGGDKEPSYKDIVDEWLNGKKEGGNQ